LNFFPFSRLIIDETVLGDGLLVFGQFKSANKAVQHQVERIDGQGRRQGGVLPRAVRLFARRFIRSCAQNGVVVWATEIGPSCGGKHMMSKFKKHVVSGFSIFKGNLIENNGPLSSLMVSKMWSDLNESEKNFLEKKAFRSTKRHLKCFIPEMIKEIDCNDSRGTRDLLHKYFGFPQKPCSPYLAFAKYYANSKYCEPSKNFLFDKTIVDEWRALPLEVKLMYKQEFNEKYKIYKENVQKFIEESKV